MQDPTPSEEKQQKALVCLQSGQFQQAKALLEEACSLNDADAHSWFLLGAVNGQLGNMDAVMRCCRNTIKLEPANIDAHYNLAQACMHKEAWPEAIESYHTVLQLQPEHVPAMNNLGYLLQKTGHYAEATGLLHQSLQLAPNDPDALNNLGNALSGLRKHEEAIACYKKAIQVNPEYAQAYNNLGGLYKKTARYEQATQAFDRALSVQPDYPEALIGKGIVLQGCGRAEEARDWFEKALALEPDSMRAVSGLLFNLNYFCVDPVQSFQTHIKAVAVVDRCGEESISVEQSVESNRPLRVGYVSADFRRHSVAFFVQPLLAAHDRDVVETWCYAKIEQPDDMTEALKRYSDHWRDITALTPDRVVEQIKKDKIDLLVDLAGHTEPDIMRIFTHRAAPVQLSWLGYPNTTGLSNLDYRLTDVQADPVGERDACHSEELVRLAGGFLCYQIPGAVPDVGPLPAGEAKFVTFGSFNNLAKITPGLVALWARILCEVPGSRLLMKNKSFADPQVRKRYYRLFAKEGIEKRRLELVGFLPRSEHFALYNRVDIGLDPFPYNGTTTTCEAIWMGVPVVTLAGRLHAGRVGVSLLSQLGLEKWIAKDADEYVSIASHWAASADVLAGLRAELRGRMTISSLCDNKAFARKIEQVFQDMSARTRGINTRRHRG